MKKLALIFSCLILLTGCASKKESFLKLNKKEHIYELGQAVDLDAASYLSVNHLNEKIGDDVLKNSIFSIEETADDRIFTANQAYEKPGTYNALITYGDEQLRFEIVIEDTQFPTINGPSLITIDSGQMIDLNQYYTINDLNEVQPIKTEKDIDIYTPGTQLVVIVGEDIAGNITKKEVNVVVNAIKPPEVIPEVPKKHIDLKIPSITSPSAVNGSNELISLYMGLNYKQPMGIDVATFLEETLQKLYGEEYETKKNNSLLPKEAVLAVSTYGKCEDATGMLVDQMINELEKGNPIVAYLTTDLKKMNIEDKTKAILNLNAVLITGYSEEKNSFLVIDLNNPQHTEISINAFNYVYDDYKYAIKIG